jgi:hypothetical protein
MEVEKQLSFLKNPMPHSITDVYDASQSERQELLNMFSQVRWDDGEYGSFEDLKSRLMDADILLYQEGGVQRFEIGWKEVVCSEQYELKDGKLRLIQSQYP